MSIKIEEDTVHDPECSSLTPNPDPEFFTVNTDAVTISEVVCPAVGRTPTPGHAPKFGGNGRNPALIVTQNGNTYRCNTRTRTNKTKKSTFVFDCNQRRYQNCPFRFQAKIILTDDPKNSEFWTKENWKILEVFENHTCDETKKDRDRIKQETRLKNEKIKQSERDERIQKYNRTSNYVCIAPFTKFEESDFTI